MSSRIARCHSEPWGRQQQNGARMGFQSCTDRNQAQRNEGAVPGVPQVLEVHGKPWHIGSDLPALSLGRCPGTQDGDFAVAPPILCVSQSCHCSAAAVHEQAAQVQRARTPGMIIPSNTRRGVPGAATGQNIPIPAQRRNGRRVCTPSP